MKSLALLWLAAIPASLLVSRMGALRVVTLVLFVTAIGGAVRGLSPMQPALPAVVREWMPAQRITLGTATYSNGLLVGEAISTSLTIPAVLPHDAARALRRRPGRIARADRWTHHVARRGDRRVRGRRRLLQRLRPR